MNGIFWSFRLEKDPDGQEARRSRYVILVTRRSSGSTDIPCLQPIGMPFTLQPTHELPEFSIYYSAGAEQPAISLSLHTGPDVIVW